MRTFLTLQLSSCPGTVPWLLNFWGFHFCPLDPSSSTHPPWLWAEGLIFQTIKANPTLNAVELLSPCCMLSDRQHLTHRTMLGCKSAGFPRERDPHKLPWIWAANDSKKMLRDLPGRPVVKISPSNTGGMGPVPGQGTKFPYTTGVQAKKEKMLREAIVVLVANWALSRCQAKRFVGMTSFYPHSNSWELFSVQFSRSDMSDSLWPHGLQHARLPCPSPTPGACSNSCPLNRWCHPTISSSVIPFSSHLQSCPVSESFLMSQFFTSGSQSIGISASASVLPVNIQDWFPWGWTGWISLDWLGLLGSWLDLLVLASF